MSLGHDENIQLHKEVVTGIVQMVKFVSGMKKNEITTLKKLSGLGSKWKSDTAQTFILEFAKDGIVNSLKDTLDKVAGGDYSAVWKFVNGYLSHFGYSPVDPVDIEV